MNDMMYINGPVSAFIAGLVTSVHCAAMCGPLACLMMPKPDASASAMQVTAVYQATRILSYTLIGACAGGLGLVAANLVSVYQVSLLRFLPWAMVLFFVLMATRLDRFIPKPKALGRLAFRLTSKFRKLPALAAGGAIGAVTPLLPCGPLYFVFALAMMTQSPVRGAEFLLSFGLGTLPLLWITQLQYAFWRTKLSPVSMDRLQRGVAVLAALFIGWRLWAAETSEGGFFCATF